MNVLTAMDDPRLFGAHFATKADTWAPWRAFVGTMTGEYARLSPSLQSIASKCTDRSDLAGVGPFLETWALCGRRAGKSRIAALFACWCAVSRDWRLTVASGEVVTIAVIAADRSQARVTLRYIRGFLRDSPLLAAMVVSETTSRITLSNSASIEVFAASSVSVRGYMLAACICDEICFWPQDGSADPDEEVLNAIRPGLATLPGTLLCISSPYARRGAAWAAYSARRDGSPVLVWNASTRTMNANIKAEVVAAALAADPERAKSEFLGEFRTDAERLLPRDVVEGAVVPGRRELPYSGRNRYVAHVDPSGGSSDAMTIAVAHAEGERIILDAIRSRTPPFSPEAVAEEFAGLLASYGLTTVVGDHYGGAWPGEAFKRHGVKYELSPLTASAIYLEALPLLNAGRVELLDDAKLIAELVSLERHTSRSGRDTISHPVMGHDDSANSACGAMVLAKVKRRAAVDFIAQTHITEAKGIPYFNEVRPQSDWANFPYGENNPSDWSW